MRTFGRIETGMWQSTKFRRLSERGQRLWIYLLSCPHGNALGCYVLPTGYIMADLNWDQETVTQTVSELLSNGSIERDETSFLTRIVGWWGHNTIENKNVAIAALKALASLPKCSVLFNFLNDITSFPKALATEYRNRYPNGYPNGIETKEPEPEPEPEPKKAPLAALDGEYAFSGKVCRLAKPDFDAWAKAHFAGDGERLRSRMQQRDDWLASPRATDEDRANWFMSTSNWLANKAKDEAKERQRVVAQKARDRPISAGISMEDALNYGGSKI